MADILIRGVEMPEYCYECPCHNGESGYCQAYKSGYLDSIERPAKCPLVPLPDGHGRLGDLDALQEEFKKYHDGKRLMLIDTALTIVPAEGGENA